MSDVVVIALGNRFRGDDAIGPLVAERVARRAPGLVVVEGAVDAMGIVVAWQGYGQVIVVDAAAAGAVAGTVHRLGSGDKPLPKDLARCSSHGGGLAEAMALGAALGRQPPALTVFAVEAKSFETGAPLSDAVAAVLDEVVELVLAEIGIGAASRVPLDASVEPSSGPSSDPS